MPRARKSCTPAVEDKYQHLQMLGRASRLTASIKPLFRNQALDDVCCPAHIFCQRMKQQKFLHRLIINNLYPLMYCVESHIVRWWAELPCFLQPTPQSYAYTGLKRLRCIPPAINGRAGHASSTVWSDFFVNC